MDDARTGLDRRTLLAVAGGAATGAVLGAAAMPTVHALRAGGGLRADGPVKVHGGNDPSGARRNALEVWQATPAVSRAGLTARYQPVGATSTDQIGEIENLLARSSRPTDLVVIDPEYLPGLVHRRLVRPLGDATGRAVADSGCYPNLMDRCRIGGALYALPLNADAPMLVADRSLLTPQQRKQLGVLRATGAPRDFWRAVLAMAAGVRAGGAAGPARLLLETGDYEGLTVCLVELIGAFGANVHDDPDLSRQPTRDAVTALREAASGVISFAVPDGKGDEDAVQQAVENRGAVFARLWPAQCHVLNTGAPSDESADGYAIIPVPGGVLGGQVLAVATRSPNGDAAEDLATHLSRPMSQLQLFHGGGYVPVSRQLYVDTQVNDELGDLGRQLTLAAQRPVVRDYTRWSGRFRDLVRQFLLHQLDSLDAVTPSLRESTGGSV